MPDRANPAPRVVVGIDGSPSSRAALAWAVSQAALTGAVVEAVVAWEFPAAVAGCGWATTVSLAAGQYEELALKMVTEVIGSAVDPGSSVRVITQVREGNAAQVLLDAAVSADLLVVGSRGHGTFAAALLGSVSMHCVQHAACPVVVIRGGNPAS